MKSFTIDVDYLENLHNIEIACLKCHYDDTEYAYVVFSKEMKNFINKQLKIINYYDVFKESSEKITAHYDYLCITDKNKSKRDDDVDKTEDNNIQIHHMPDWRLKPVECNLYALKDIKYEEYDVADYESVEHLQDHIDHVYNISCTYIEESSNKLLKAIKKYITYLQFISEIVKNIDNNTKQILATLKSKKQLVSDNCKPAFDLVMLPYPRHSKQSKYYDPNELPDI